MIYKTFAEIIEIAEGQMRLQDLRTEEGAIFDAYEKLEGEEKTRIATMAKALVGHVSRDLPIIQFDFYDALEVLAKLGIFLVLKARQPA